MIVLIPLHLILDNPFQTRAAYAEEAIRELADSIRGLRDARPETAGLIHVPPARVVDALEPGGPVEPRHALVTEESMETYRYQVAAGHSRLRAFRLLAGDDPEAWGAMPLDLGVLDDQAMADVAWAENQKRKDLSAIEEARALQAAMARFGWTQEQVAGRWKLARSTVANKLRLLGLPADLQEKVIAGEVGERAVRALLPALDAGVDEAVKTGLESIINGGAPDAVERAVTWELKRRSVDLSEGHWSPDWPGARHGLDVPPCQGCRHRRKLDGDWRCFDADCYKRKAAAWNDHQVALAIAAEQEHCGTKLVKYPHYDYGMVTFNYNNAQTAVFDATCRPGCKHGRLGLLANVPGWMARDRDSRKAREGEAWFVCDRSRCMGSLSSHTTRAETDWERERREAEERVRARIAEIMDQARVELDAATVSRLFGQAKLRDFVMKGVMDAVRDDRLKRELKKGRWDVATDLGFWRAVALAWLAAAPGSVWSSTDVDATMGARYRELRAGLGLPEQASVDGAGVSPETPDPDLQDPDGDEAAAAALLRETQAGIRAALAAAAGPAWTCCVCGQSFGAGVPVGLALLDGDQHPQAGAYLCETCLRDTPAGGAAVAVEGLAAAAYFVLQQGTWQPDVCVLNLPCLLCGRTGSADGPQGWAVRDVPAGQAHEVQLCPACAAAGRAYRVTAWSPNGKNPHLSHYWSYQQDGSWASACGQVQPVPWRPEADTAKHCASCARIVKAETG